MWEHKNIKQLKEKQLKKWSKWDIYKKFSDGRFKVSIFGSARIKPENEIYQDIKRLAGLIAEEGFDVITGGGPGIMTAAAEWHRQALDECEDHKADTIGINIVLPFEQMPNKHMNILDTHKTFSTRLDTFMLLSNIVVVAPWGIGTTLELFYTWQLMQVGHICKVPIIVYGEMWDALMGWVEMYITERGFAKPEDLDMIVHADSPAKAMSYINKAHEFFEEAGEHACVNAKLYVDALKQMDIDV